MLKKILVIPLQKLDLLSAVSMRLVQLTGKHSYPVHPKHLIEDKVLYSKYLKKSDVVLDLGCGNRLNLLKIAKKIKKAIGLEVDTKLINLARSEAKTRSLKNVRFLVADANKKLPFDDAKFSKVICSDVLEHLNRRVFAIKEIRRVLIKSGFLLLVTDNPQTSWKKLQKSVGLFYYADKDHKYEYSKSEILKLLQKNKFNVKSVDYVTYDTPLRGIIDLTGGISLTFYKKLKSAREQLAKNFPQETTGFRIIAQKL